MHRNRSSNLAWVVVAALSLQGCGEAPVPTQSIHGPLGASVSSLGESSRHVVLFYAEHVPADFAARVATLGGAVEAALDSIGVATVTGLSSAAAAALAGEPDVRNLEPDVMMALPADAAGEDIASEPAAPADVSATTTSSTSAQFYARQWNMRAVFADQVWAAGFLGSHDVVVAILDSGIDYLHPDLLGLVDLSRSKSFAPEEDPVVDATFPGRLPISDLFWHGTAVSSIVASNAKVVAGINHDVTLIAVKVWNRFNQGSFARLLTGIVYATDQGADVINVGGGYAFDKNESPGIVAAVERAVNYSFRKGAVFVSVAGNGADDLDHDGDMVHLPCQATHVICVSATGPTGAAGLNGPWVNVDAPSPYSGFGRSTIDVAAPGGAGEVGQFRRIWLPCTTTPTEFTPAPACRAHQPVAQGLGTSFAGAHVTGLAALLVSQLGHGNPELIRARILQSADDLGDPGHDPYYGEGRINVARALQLTY